jgi:hypothetical protein
MRNTKTISISLAPKQFKTAVRLAKKQSRTMSELFREGLRRLEQDDELTPPRAALTDLGGVIRLIQQSAKEAGLDKMTKREINAEIAAARRERAAKTERAVKRPGR